MLRLSPFAFYEQANKKIIIDGVSSQYALGVVGLQLNSNVTDNFELLAAAGYGLASNQKSASQGQTSLVMFQEPTQD